MTICNVCGVGPARLPNGVESPEGEPPAHPYCREQVRRDAQRRDVLDDEPTVQAEATPAVSWDPELLKALEEKRAREWRFNSLPPLGSWEAHKRWRLEVNPNPQPGQIKID